MPPGKQNFLSFSTPYTKSGLASLTENDREELIKHDFERSALQLTRLKSLKFNLAIISFYVGDGNRPLCGMFNAMYFWDIVRGI